jgi:hypothetical protein
MNCGLFARRWETLGSIWEAAVFLRAVFGELRSGLLLGFLAKRRARSYDRRSLAGLVLFSATIAPWDLIAMVVASASISGAAAQQQPCNNPIQKLDGLRKAGSISDAEFARLRARLVQQYSPRSAAPRLW